MPKVKILSKYLLVAFTCIFSVIFIGKIFAGTSGSVLDFNAGTFKLTGGAILGEVGALYGLIVKNGKVGIGTVVSDSLLAVSGVIESSTGGFKFPDGSVQTTAASGASGTDCITMPPSAPVLPGYTFSKAHILSKNLNSTSCISYPVCTDPRFRTYCPDNNTWVTTNSGTCRNDTCASPCNNNNEFGSVDTFNIVYDYYLYCK